MVETGRVNLTWARSLIGALMDAGARHACVSPGSRSSPLAVAVAEKEGDGLSASVHIDERGAGYFAVGHSRATGAPAVLVCTSGTAAANYLPAVIEAHYSRVPLVVITADRPPELRDSGAWQTIDQQKLYGPYTRWFAELATPNDDESMLRYVCDVAERAVAHAMGRPAGPVHLNVPFREPLLPEGGPPFAAGAVADGEGVGGAAGASTGVRPSATPLAVLPVDDISAIARQLAAAPRGLILAGQLDPPPGYAAAVARLAAATGYPILAEPMGHLRFGAHDRSHVVSRHEALLRSREWSDGHAPDVVIRFGASFVWRPVTEYLAAQHHALRIVVDPQHTWDDPTRLPSTRLAVDPVPFCEVLAGRLERLDGVGCAGTGAGRRNAESGTASEWLQAWLDADAAAEAVLADRLAARGSASATTPWVHRAIAELAGDGALIHAANSMAVRDLDSFAASSAKAVRCIANRGAAGIDGTVSSALGAAFGSRAPTVLLTGDLAFAHDVNGLAAAHLPGLDVAIVVLNDQGGGIFEYLPVAWDGDVFRRFFTAPSGLDVGAACRAYGVSHTIVADKTALAAAVQGGSGIRVVEVCIDRAANTAWHTAYWDSVAAALQPIATPPTV